MASGVRAASKLPVALIQMSVTANKQGNLVHAKDLISKAASAIRTSDTSGVNKPLIVLPECFNSPYGVQYFEDYAETIPGETTQMLSNAAKEEEVYLIGGSIPERKSGTIYNTCVAFNPSGNMVMKFSKLHLFDINIPGKISFKESHVMQGGDELGILELFNGIKVGVGICYDMRFSDLSMLLTREGCKLLVFPGAFNMTTGAAHWQLIQRGRAVDNQVYVASCSPARDMTASYTAWGHSMVVSPWGEVLSEASDAEDIITVELDFDYVDEVRKQVPIHHQRREDIYKLTKVKSNN